MAAPFDLGKEVAASNLKIGSTYYHMSPIVPYHKVTIERVDTHVPTNYYHVVTNEGNVYGVRLNNPINKFYLIIDPEHVRKIILQVAQTKTPYMSARPGRGPYNKVREFLGVQYKKHPPKPKSPSPTSPPKSKGGYRATARDKKYLARLRAGKSIGFTMRASLKAKGLLPRANGSRRVSEKYRAQKRNVTRRRA
jgi:hypothetical protein